MTETRRFTVSGLVQGVWYRRHAADAASKIGVAGWVRNTSDGKVELLAKGDPQQFEQLLAALWEGSPMSNVTAVDQEVADEFPGDGFEIDWVDSVISPQTALRTNE